MAQGDANPNPGRPNVNSSHAGVGSAKPAMRDEGNNRIAGH
jgi:hypothetical protein